ncbi:hypothetical protein GYB22_01475, partial [bacterium]|nr:hypothetical protein [bacterium]
MLSLIVHESYSQDTANFEGGAPFYHFTQKVNREGGDAFWDVTYYTLNWPGVGGTSYGLDYYTYDKWSKKSEGTIRNAFRYDNDNFYINKYLIKADNAAMYIKGDWYLAYNTSLNVGDTLYHFEFDLDQCSDSSCKGLYSVLDAIEYVLINNIYHKVQHFSLFDPNQNIDLKREFYFKAKNYTVIEGFGLLNSPINYLSGGSHWGEWVERYCLYQWSLDEYYTIEGFGKINFDCDFLSTDDLESTQFKVTNPNYNSVRVFGSTQFEYRILN